MNYTMSELQEIDEDDKAALAVAEKAMKQSTIADFLNDNETKIKTDDGNLLLVLNKEEAAQSLRSIINHYDRPYVYEIDDNKIIDLARYTRIQGQRVCGFILPSGKVLINADLDESIGESDSFVTKMAEFKMPTVSYRCLIRCLIPGISETGVKNAHYTKLFQLLEDGDLRLVDFTPDVFVKSKTYRSGRGASKKEQADMEAKGFTYLYNGTYHKPSTVLVCYTHDNGKLTSFVLGVDESQYFGCELPYGENPSTIKVAFEALKPEAIRKTKSLLRQGEWFAVPVKGTVVPPAHECLLVDVITLPKEDKKSSDHQIFNGEIRVGVNGTLYAKNFRLEHSNGDHAELRGKRDNWYTFVRNTAVRSVSQQGVD